MTAPRGLEAAFRDQRRHLWGLCYQMTGCAADADDLLQDTFARAIERPPRDLEKPWRPWLVRVAMNLSRDHLRRRRRRGYTGPWLPSPVEPPGVEAILDAGITTEGRYDLYESVSMAFLIALEELTPQKRAVLVLRDVFDYTVAETADALELSEANVKTTLHRARKHMAAYEASRTPASAEDTAAVLEQLLVKLAGGDVDGLAAMLADDVRALSDGGGEFHAALNPIHGRDKVTRFLFGLMKLRGMPSGTRATTVNGAPAVVVDYDVAGHGRASPRTVITIELDADGKVRRFYSVMATRKLTAISSGEAA